MEDDYTELRTAPIDKRGDVDYEVIPMDKTSAQGSPRPSPSVTPKGSVRKTDSADYSDKTYQEAGRYFQANNLAVPPASPMIKLTGSGTQKSSGYSNILAANSKTGQNLKDSYSSRCRQLDLEKCLSRAQRSEQIQAAVEGRTKSTQWRGHDSDPQTYYTLGILSLFCCFPVSIISLCYSNKVTRQLKHGQLFEASKYSRRALIYGLLSVFTGVVFITCVIMTYVFYFKDVRL